MSEDAVMERELRAVEDALASGAASADDPVERELQELALALRADAPEPDAAFAGELGQRVKRGFAGERTTRRPTLARHPRLRHELDGLRRNIVPLGSAAAAAVVVAAIAIALPTGPGDGDDAGGGADGGGGGAVSSAPDARDLAAPSSGGAEIAPAPPVEPPIVPPGRQDFAPGRAHRIERSVALELAAPDADIPEVAERVTRVTDRHGGFVLRSSSNSDEDGASGFFELRIPAGRLRQAVRDLSALATVRSQDGAGQDVTPQVVSARDRLTAARAERRGLLRRLEDAATDAEAEALRRRLDLVAGEIRGLRGQLRDLRLRVAYAVVTVELTGEDSGEGGGAGGLGDAVDDAGGLLVGAAGVLLRVLAVALPLALVALLLWLAARALQRRRRESALA
jgi:hypothetical protein